MSSVLIEGSSSPVFQDVNDDGGLSIIGKRDEPSNFILEGEGDDIVFGGSQGGLINTGAGDDLIIGGDGVFSIDAGEGNDVIIGGKGINNIDGGDGADIIIGGDSIDIIEGGKGADMMFGGGGNDVFQYDIMDIEGGEMDFILDFTEGEDKIQIEGAASVEYDSSTGMVSIDGTDAIFLDAGLDITAQDTDEDGTWELM